MPNPQVRDGLICVPYDRGDMSILADLLGGEIGARIGRWRNRRLTSGERGRSVVQSALRVAKGSSPGLTSRWVTGMAHLEPGRIDFATAGLRSRRVTLPLTGPLTVTDHGVGRHGVTRVNPRARVVLLDLGRAVVEWAIMPEDLEWTLSRLQERP